MMRVVITTEERFIDEAHEDNTKAWRMHGDPVVEMTDAEWTEYRSVCDRFEEWQDKLQKMGRNAAPQGPKDPRPWRHLLPDEVPEDVQAQAVKYFERTEWDRNWKATIHGPDGDYYLHGYEVYVAPGHPKWAARADG